MNHGYATRRIRSALDHAPTKPSNRWFPPLIAIDHVLTGGGAVTTKVETVGIAGSDHRAVLARAAIPW